MKREIFDKRSFFLAKENERLSENDDKQDADIADDCDKNFVHDLKSEYMKKQKIIISKLKTRFIFSSWWFLAGLLFTDLIKGILDPAYQAR